MENPFKFGTIVDAEYFTDAVGHKSSIVAENYLFCKASF